MGIACTCLLTGINLRRIYNMTLGTGSFIARRVQNIIESFDADDSQLAKEEILKFLPSILSQAGDTPKTTILLNNLLAMCAENLYESCLSGIWEDFYTIIKKLDAVIDAEVKP
jgi:F0F1-type ATP synthase delta subunit